MVSGPSPRLEWRERNVNRIKRSGVWRQIWKTVVCASTKGARKLSRRYRYEMLETTCYLPVVYANVNRLFLFYLSLLTIGIY